MVSYLNTKASLIFWIVIPHKISLTIQERHSLSSMFVSKFSFRHRHFIYVAFLHWSHNHNLQYYQPRSHQVFFIFLTFDNVRLTSYFPSFSGKFFHHPWSLPWDHQFIIIIQNSRLCIVAIFLFKYWSGTFWRLNNSKLHIVYHH